MRGYVCLVQTGVKQMSGTRQLTIRQSAIQAIVLESGVVMIPPLIALILEYELECRSHNPHTTLFRFVSSESKVLWWVGGWLVVAR